jgi:acyl-CoA synthetase (AMP-forming)/AMP-acid ligase II
VSPPRLTDLVTSDERRAGYQRAGHWNETTLSAYACSHAETKAAGTAVVDLDGGRTATYGELQTDVDRFAGYLTELGVTTGDVVSVQLPNWYETVVVDLAILTVGAVLNPLLPLYRERELRHILAASASRAFVTSDEYRGFPHAELAASLRHEIPTLLHHVIVPNPEGDRDAFRDRLRKFQSYQSTTRAAAGAVSELLFTSGTEAAPKAVMHTEQTAGYAARAASAAMAMTPQDIVWMPSPLGHSTGLNYGLRIAITNGVPLVLQDRWSADSAARLVERHGCTYTVAATTFAADLIEHARSMRSCDLSSLRLFGSGGAPVPPETVLEAARHGIRLLRLYGSTEVLVATWNRPDGSEEKRVTTDGVPLPGVELRVLDATDRPVIGERGEIYVRSPSTSVGFLADPDRTAATFDADGWVRSGDLGVIDADGFLTIVGRRKEIIIRGGLNIAPREIEDVICELPAVEKVAVLGLPDERLGEITCACVVLRPGAELALDELIAELKTRGLATFKLPQRLEIVDELPCTATGKVQKHRLVAALTADSAEAAAIRAPAEATADLTARMELYAEPEFERR